MAVRDDISDRARDRIGTTLRGKWTLDGVIGVGGMATVYAATHRNNSRVAIKMLHPEVSVDAEVTARFLREGYVANIVEHQGTVQIFDDDVAEDGAAFLVMELLEGETLEARWERKGQQLPASEVLPVVDQLLDVLAAAHARGVIHRDLKPENLFLTRDGRLKVLDFGIARLRELSKHSGATTKVGSLLGTPAFMAPEQALGRLEEVDHRTDLWAVGATLFTLLSGRYVHEADTINEQLILAATVDAPSIAQFCAHLPVPVVRLVDRALSFKKADRWADSRAMQGGLREAQESLDLPALSLPRPSLHEGSPPTLAAASLRAEDLFTNSALDEASDVGSIPALTTTGDPLTSTADPTLSVPPVRSRKTTAAVAIAALLVVAIIGVIGVRSVSAEHADRADKAAGTAHDALGPEAQEPKPDPSVALAPAPSAQGSQDGSQDGSAQAPSPSAPKPAKTTHGSVPVSGHPPAPATAKPPVSAKPIVTAQPTATSKPTAQPPATSKPAPESTGNPFDRRH